MAKKSMRASLDVDSNLHLRPDGWEFLSYDTAPAGSGFLIRDGRQDANKHRLEILYWKQDREQDETQLVLDAETGNLGIGVTPSSARLEVGGTVKATSFEGSGAGLMAIKAASISDGKLTANQVPDLGDLNGILPTNKLSGQLSQWTTSGAAISYTGKVSIGALPQGSGNLDATKRAASEAAQAAKALSDAVQSWFARLNASEFSGEAANIGSIDPIRAAADAAKAAAQAADQATTPFQIIQAVGKAGRQSGNVAAQVEALTERVKNLFYDRYWRISTDFRIEQGEQAVMTLDSLDIGQHDSFGSQIAEARQKSSRALEQSFGLFVANVMNAEPTRLAVNGDGGLTGSFRCWGDILGSGSIQGANSDLAENYLSDHDLAAADVVCLDRDRDRIVPSDKANDTLVIGVVSSEPGFLLNATAGEDRAAGTLAYPVALCGRVPCKVTDENGPIQRGDLLTTSSTPGHAMKAVPVNLGGIELQRPGTIIGKALEALPAGKGVIEVFINLR